MTQRDLVISNIQQKIKDAICKITNVDYKPAYKGNVRFYAYNTNFDPKDLAIEFWIVDDERENKNTEAGIYLAAVSENRREDLLNRLEDFAHFDIKGHDNRNRVFKYYDLNVDSVSDENIAKMAKDFTYLNNICGVI